MKKMISLAIITTLLFGALPQYAFASYGFWEEGGQGVISTDTVNKVEGSEGSLKIEQPVGLDPWYPKYIMYTPDKRELFEDGATYIFRFKYKTVNVRILELRVGDYYNPITIKNDTNGDETDWELGVTQYTFTAAHFNGDYLFVFGALNTDNAQRGTFWIDDFAFYKVNADLTETQVYPISGTGFQKYKTGTPPASIPLPGTEFANMGNWETGTIDTITKMEGSQASIYKEVMTGNPGLKYIMWNKSDYFTEGVYKISFDYKTQSSSLCFGIGEYRDVKDGPDGWINLAQASQWTKKEFDYTFTAERTLISDYLFRFWDESGASLWVDNIEISKKNADGAYAQIYPIYNRAGFVTPKDVTAPGVVTNIVAEENHKSVTLTWTNPSDSDFAKVNIYMDGGELPYQVVQTPQSSVTIPELTNGQEYTFTLKTVDALGNESNGVSITAVPQEQLYVTSSYHVSASDILTLAKTGPVNATATVTVTNNEKGNDFTAELLCVLYKDKMLVQFFYSGTTTIPQGSAQTITTNIALPQLVGTGYEMKLFLWNSLLGLSSLKPSQTITN